METPEVILGKIANGLRSLFELPVEDQKLDMALSVQAQRFRGLAEFFASRKEMADREGHVALSKELDKIGADVEEYRLTFLTTGKKTPLIDYAEKSDGLTERIKELWQKEDDVHDGGEEEKKG